MAGGTQVPVYLGRVGEQVVIRPEGACTIAICETVRASLVRLQSESVTDVHLDLSLAEWIDSTFAGYLVSLVTREPRAGFNIHLVSPSPAAARSLEQMHVLSLFDIRDQIEVEPATWDRLCPVEADKASAASGLLNAHECLIEVDPRNKEVFAPVVKLFRGQHPAPRDPQRESSAEH